MGCYTISHPQTTHKPSILSILCPSYIFLHFPLFSLHVPWESCSLRIGAEKPNDVLFFLPPLLSAIPLLHFQYQLLQLPSILCTAVFYNGKLHCLTKWIHKTKCADFIGYFLCFQISFPELFSIHCNPHVPQIKDCLFPDCSILMCLQWNTSKDGGGIGMRTSTNRYFS